MTHSTGLLDSAYRAVRTVRAREDGPWPGVLARSESGGTCVLVDADVLGVEWRGWDAAPDGHVLAPVDIARRADGHDVVLPVCIERLHDFVRRRGARAPLSTGEAVTLGVSILRGCAQLTDAPDATGEWWLDDTGRPLVATDVGSSEDAPTTAERVREGAAAMLGAIAVEPRLRGAWEATLHAVSADRLTAADIADAEDALFAAAVPEPLSTMDLGAAAPGPRSALVAREPGPDSGQRLAVPAGSGADRTRSVWRALLEGADPDLADTVSRTTTAVWRKLRSDKRTSRRAPWVVGGSVAAVVLAGGVLWPAAGGMATGSPESIPAPATATPVAGATVPSVPEAAGPVTADPIPEAGADPAATTAALLETRAACGSDSACLTDVVADPATTFTGGAIDLAAGERSVTLLDEFGDVAVLRVDANDGSLPAQLIVIVRRDDEWLLRDVHDVAQQP